MEGLICKNIAVQSISGFPVLNFVHLPLHCNRMQSHEHIIILALPVDLHKAEIKYCVKQQALLSSVRFSTPLYLCLLAEVHI